MSSEDDFIYWIFLPTLNVSVFRPLLECVSYEGLKTVTFNVGR